MQTHHVTCSGFLKVEVYNDLKKALIEKDHTRVCYLIAELACTKGELANLYDALIEAHAKYFLSSNTWVLDRVMTILSILRHLPKKNLLKNLAFQKHLCEWGLLLSVQHVKAATTLGFDIRPLTVTENARIEALGTGVVIDQSATRLHQALYNKVSHDVFKTFTAFYQALHASQFRDAHSIVRFLMCTKEHFVDEITYDAIEHVKRNLRKDMVWYIWKILSIFAEDKEHTVLLRAYVDRALAIYAHQYKKKHRLSRIPFLMYTCWVACHPEKRQGHKSGLRHQETSYPLQEAVQNVHIVFSEILAKEEDENEEEEQFENVTNYKQPAPVQQSRRSKKRDSAVKVSSSKASHTVNNREEPPSLDYLKVCTYYDSSTPPPRRMDEHKSGGIKLLEIE